MVVVVVFVLVEGVEIDGGTVEGGAPGVHGPMPVNTIGATATTKDQLMNVVQNIQERQNGRTSEYRTYATRATPPALTSAEVIQTKG